MRAPVSVVIPTLNAADELPATLGCLAEGLEAGLIRELVVSDGGSTDATPAIAEEAGAILVTGAAGRGGQIRRGIAAAGGQWFLVLHADTRLSPGWAGPVLARLSATDTAHHFRLKFRATGMGAQLVAGWANLRSRVFHLPYGDQGLLISRALLEEIGGYPDLPIMEDVALARRLHRRLAPLPAVASTDARRYLAEGWLRRGARNWWTLAQYLAGADPARLARAYHSEN